MSDDFTGPLTHPQYRGLAGAAKAAELSGDKERATIYYTKLVALASGSISDRPELVAAKQFLAKKNVVRAALLHKPVAGVPPVVKNHRRGRFNPDHHRRCR